MSRLWASWTLPQDLCWAGCTHMINIDLLVSFNRRTNCCVALRPQIFSCLDQILSLSHTLFFASVPSLLNYFCPSLSFCLCFSLLRLLIHPSLLPTAPCLCPPPPFSHICSSCWALPVSVSLLSFIVCTLSLICSQVTKVRNTKLLLTLSLTMTPNLCRIAQTLLISCSNLQWHFSELVCLCVYESGYAKY